MAHTKVIGAIGGDARPSRVKAYLEYIRFVERLHEATTTPAAGYFAEAAAHKIPP